ncbi:pyridoxamine 5'-phosphate oxidase family protein [Nocardia panacis]|uniref:Pyridoxamine 5'-phosphate oxidase family protein n=1 Tax=Nocardia panacis TaxID=2340916 RepID=A0A3A4JXB1_9NOCA|nr:pyridoxamine 5'-phosphate oxidase family protein [Nocardia panacis]RJO75269.1 pyridoxamine 5'-phosphate oxidase family protein [Nocardia panacis]
MTPFHSGEMAVQRRMGQSEIAARTGRMIRSEIPPVAADFLAAQSEMVLAAADAAGRLWAGAVTGRPGFAHAIDARTIDIAALPAMGDPLREALSRSTRIGLLALQPQRRRRMRVNGMVDPMADGLRITTEQVFSNCPKYISRREIESRPPSGTPSRPLLGTELDAEQRARIAAADTFFIATADRDGNADASHRGGNPGFLQALSSTRLRWPDYRGNSLFMTLGNIAVQPRCGLLVRDWATGDTLQLTGTAELVSDADALAVEFTLAEVVEMRGALGLRWSGPELSPANP